MEVVQVRRRGRPKKQVDNEEVLVKFTIPKRLLEIFDEKVTQLGYKSRSEALRELIRQKISQ